MIAQKLYKYTALQLVLVILFCTCHIAAAIDNNEEVIYNTQNTADSTINAIEIIRSDTKEQLFYRSVDVSPVNRNTWNLSKAWQLAAFFPEVGSFVPEQVEVSWRKLPKQGQAMYRGDIVGPHILKLRSRIPVEVLRKSREAGYDLSIMFLVGKSPVTFCWRLGDYKSAPPNNIVLQTGGDCITDPYLKQITHIYQKVEGTAKTVVQPVTENWSIVEKNNPNINDLKILILDTKNSHYSPTIPKELEVSWKKISKNNGSTKVQIVGPFIVKVRTLIPLDVLKLSADRYHYINISLNTDSEPPIVCWKFWDKTESSKGRLVSSGSDC